jgi:flagellar motor switch protein FliN/FliY
VSITESREESQAEVAGAVDLTALAAEAAAALGLGVPVPLAGPLNRASDLPPGTEAVAVALEGPGGSGELVLATMPGHTLPSPEAWDALAAALRVAHAELTVGAPVPVAEPLADAFAGHDLVAVKRDAARAAIVGVRFDGHPGVPELPTLEPHGLASGPVRSLASLSDVEMAVTVELGRTTLAVRDLLGLHAGAVIQLDQTVGTAAEIFVNGTHIGSGEVVVVDGSYGVRVTRLIGTD